MFLFMTTLLAVTGSITLSAAATTSRPAAVHGGSTTTRMPGCWTDFGDYLLPGQQVTYSDGASCDMCRCNEETGKLSCRRGQCQPPMCVDHTLAPGDCCYICPNGPNCFIPSTGETIRAGLPVLRNGLSCQCPTQSRRQPADPSLADFTAVCQPAARTSHGNGSASLHLHGRTRDPPPGDSAASAAAVESTTNLTSAVEYSSSFGLGSNHSTVDDNTTEFTTVVAMATSSDLLTTQVTVPVTAATSESASPHKISRRSVTALPGAASSSLHSTTPTHGPRSTQPTHRPARRNGRNRIVVTTPAATEVSGSPITNTTLTAGSTTSESITSTVLNTTHAHADAVTAFPTVYPAAASQTTPTAAAVPESRTLPHSHSVVVSSGTVGTSGTHNPSSRILSSTATPTTTTDSLHSTSATSSATRDNVKSTSEASAVLQMQDNATLAGTTLSVLGTEPSDNATQHPGSDNTTQHVASDHATQHPASINDTQHPTQAPLSSTTPKFAGIDMNRFLEPGVVLP